MSEVADNHGSLASASRGLGEGDGSLRTRPCTCHPSEAPTPCAHQYALSECLRAAALLDIGAAMDRLDAALKVSGAGGLPRLHLRALQANTADVVIVVRAAAALARGAAQ